MTQITIKQASNQSPDNHDLNMELINLLQYGSPRLSHLDSGWYCKIEMKVLVIGVKFDVKSEFGHPTPLSALLELKDRINAVLKKQSQS